MRLTFVVSTALLLASAANARDVPFRLFFDTSGNAAANNAPHPGEATLGFDNPILPDGGGRLYLYAMFMQTDTNVYSPNMDIVIDGGTITEAWNYNGEGQDTRGGPDSQRWKFANPNPLTHPNTSVVEFTAANITGFGLKNDATHALFDIQYDDSISEFGTTLLGYVDVANDPGQMAEVRYRVGQIGFAIEGGLGDLFFGFGDGPNENPLPDATIVPEPATLIMFCLASLLLSRRRAG